MVEGSAKTRPAVSGKKKAIEKAKTNKSFPAFPPETGWLDKKGTLEIFSGPSFFLSRSAACNTTALHCLLFEGRSHAPIAVGEPPCTFPKASASCSRLLSAL